MSTIISDVQALTTETASFTSVSNDYVATSSTIDDQLVTATVSQGFSTSTTPTATSGSNLITAAPGTASSSVTVVLVFTATETSSSNSPSSVSHNNASGLSPGAITGIVIGSLACLVFFILVVFCSSRRFAKKKRRETQLLTVNAAPQLKPMRPRDPSQAHEMATHYNQLEVDGRGKTFEMVGSHLHPAELQAGSMADMEAHEWKEGPPGVSYPSPDVQGGEAAFDGKGSGEYLGPGSWETMSLAGMSGDTQGGDPTSKSTSTLQEPYSDQCRNN
ncbi:hypothetical protein VM1G_05215 [Cytospora mali]|uniref:Uncharacterized protein n=1 Tax=Cytospora mali TaxID=578113 RepID=A0A194W0D7_CYTMA|nr:hypothetical protein VM1G_05215 [Valsa mali]